VLSDTFYTIKSFKTELSDDNSSKCLADIQFILTNPIFQGHFPDNPVVPGVCQIQILKEILEVASNQKLNLFEADNVKYLMMIDPFKIPCLNILITFKLLSESVLSATATYSYESEIVFRFKGKFKVLGQCL